MVKDQVMVSGILQTKLDLLKNLFLMEKLMELDWQTQGMVHLVLPCNILKMGVKCQDSIVWEAIICLILILQLVEDYLELYQHLRI
jgi:hypothetical protein